MFQEDAYEVAQNIKLRQYQVDMVEKVKKRNSILFLPTGSGKTLVAIHTLCSKTSEIVGDFAENAKRAFFVAPTKVLVFQLFKTLSIHTKFKVGHFVGDMLVDLWNKEMWQEQFKKFQVIVLTGEILRQILELKSITPSQISLIVFDECHHAILQHPFKMILQFINQGLTNKPPLILGLTAVLLNTNPKRKDVNKIITDMQNIFRAVVVTTKTEESGRFAAKPKEAFIHYKSSDSLVANYLPFYDETIKILEELKLVSSEQLIPKDSKPFKNPNRARKFRNWFVNAKEILEECGLYCGTLSVLYYMLLVEKTRLLATDPEEIQVLIYCRTALYKIRHILMRAMGEETFENIYNFSSNKIQTFLSLLLSNNKNSGGKHLSTIVFVYRKTTAITIATMLKQLKRIDTRFSFMEPEFIVGSSIFDKETLLHERRSNDSLVKEFSSGNLNVLVSTNLLEEGIDISVCNVVMSFDFPVSYASYFQTRGRARDKGGIYYMFVNEKEVLEKNLLLREYQQIEDELYKIIFRDESKSSSIFLDPEDYDDDISSLPIRAVYRYCGKLPQDKYSFLSPSAWYTEEREGKKASVILPINSPLRDIIEGDLMSNSKSAKKSAFLEVLKKLKEIGEVDENWNPTSFGVKMQSFDYLFPHYKNETVEENEPLPGTKKRKRFYEVKFAQSLSECLPQPGEKAYLHIIDFTFDFEGYEREEKVELQEALQCPVTFAILSSKKLFRICDFSMFIDFGRIQCNLLINYDEIVLSISELEDIKLCHLAVFEKVLQITKTHQIFDRRNKGHSFYIVPVRENEIGRFVIDWDLICCDFCKGNNLAVVGYNPTQGRCARRNSNVVSSQETGQVSEALVPLSVVQEEFRRPQTFHESNQRHQFVMSEATYKNFVISPNYRQFNPQTYIVRKFCYDLTPLSPFPNSLYPDYCAYYKERYTVEITNVTQPLMKVAAIFSCSNFNRPRYKQQQKKRTSRTFAELLVPELCDVILFDRKYWVKALLLPTALNRLYHLYRVEEFRRKIINDTGLGTAELPENVKWKPLQPDDSLSNNEDLEKEFTPFEVTLPLSNLRQKQKPDANLIDLKKSIFDVGVCDLEYLVSFCKNVTSQDELLDSLTKAEVEEEISTELRKLRQIPIPSLEIFKTRQQKIGSDLAQLVQALTSASANDCINYERLEILGDAFLKFAVSTYLFKNLNSNEGVLTTLKGKLVGNRNLFYCGVAKGFQYALNVTDFAPLFDWNPPLLCLPEKLAEAIRSNNADPAVMYKWDISPEERFSGNLSHATLSKNEKIIRNYEKACEGTTNSLIPYKEIGDKTISDSVEAVVGVYLRDFGLFGGFEILMWLDILPKVSGSYGELLEKVYMPKLLSGCGVESVANIVNEVLYLELEKTLGYSFRNKAFLLEALTHPTYARNRVTHCYQRLEFLGDAILDFLITSYIYEHCGELTPGQVTDIRSALVNNVTFASLTVRFGFHKYLLKLSSRLHSAIEEFVTYQIRKNHAIDDDLLILLEEENCSTAEAVQVPKALGDIFESLAGAIFLDSGNSLQTVWDVYYPLMKKEIDEFTKTIPKNPVRLLHEICKDRPYFEITKGEDLMKSTCTVWYENTQIKVHGLGKNKKEAKRSAAKLALSKITKVKK